MGSKNMMLSKNLIVNRFHQSYDPSMIWQYVSSDFRDLESIGRGFHFNSFKVQGQGQFPFALSISRDGFLRGSELKTWIQALGQLRQVKHPLIPPMEFGVYEEKAFYVTPFCSDKISSSRSMQEHLETLTTALKNKGLMVEDYWQIRLMDGHPFVIDWSDLKVKTL